MLDVQTTSCGGLTDPFFVPPVNGDLTDRGWLPRVDCRRLLRTDSCYNCITWIVSSTLVGAAHGGADGQLVRASRSKR